MVHAKRISSGSRERSNLRISLHKPLHPPALPTAGDEKDISRLVSNVGKPEAVRENSGQVRQFEETSQNGKDDNWDFATVDGDELDALIEKFIKDGKQTCDLCDVLAIRIKL